MIGSAEKRDITELAAFAQDLADAAARVSLPYFRSNIPVTDKNETGDFDPVTRADHEAEAAIRALIARTYPDHGILGEEGGHAPGASNFTWVLDPIDGTRSFVAGLPLWTTLIALNDGHAPLIGLIDQPYLGERFIGTPDGAFLKARGTQRRLATRPQVSLKDAIFTSTTPAMFQEPGDRAIHDAITKTARLTRYGCDAYGYALLAMGHVDLVVEVGLKPWDVQALIPIIRGAGGVVTNFEGGPADAGGRVIAAANERLLGECLALIKNAV